MNMKKILCFVMVSVLLLATCTNALAENMNDVDSETSADALKNQASAEYRAMDVAVGNILEAYDTEINGDNAIDYYALATSMSESKADRIAAMNFIITIYDIVTIDEKRWLKTYMYCYAPYAGEDNLLLFCDQLKTNRQETRSMYFGQGAVNYALAHYNNYNTTEYPNLDGFGGDCANFASQCMYAGGATMDEVWFIRKLDDQYPAPTRIQELNTSWELADPSPWISAPEFNAYWSERATETFTCTTTEYKNDDFREIFYRNSIYKGYPFQLLEPNLWWYEAWHTMIIVDYIVEDTDFMYAQHSYSKDDGEIRYDICRNEEYDDHKLQFFYFQNG